MAHCSRFISSQAYELSTLTGTQVLLLVASETGHVYTFATRKLQPMITSETGKALIQTCLNSPDSPPRSDPSMDQRMSATGFEETDLTYQVSESESMGDTKLSLESCDFDPPLHPPTPKPSRSAIRWGGYGCRYQRVGWKHFTNTGRPASRGVYLGGWQGCCRRWPLTSAAMSAA
ncbi:hypothetical protein GOODEAATRI_001188 [Goodea atripinnis]|uniref:MADS-box domain-containing protein n=1 Tax=Goodea atripinnis TaxID=208336 RepID=A0ABV0PUF6_9TELE